jgi:hypothetical protein
MLSSKVTANAEKELLDLAKRGDLNLLNAKLEEHDQFITRMKTDVHHFRDQGDLHVNEDISYLPTSASDIYRGSMLNEGWLVYVRAVATTPPPPPPPHHRFRSLRFLCGKERWKEAIEWLEDLSDDEMRREMAPGKKAAGVKAAHKATGLKATVKPHPLQLACGAKKDEDAQILVSLLVDKAIALKLSSPAEHQQWFFTLCKAGRCSDAAAWLEAVEGTESVREELTYVDPTENQSGKTLGNKTALNFVCETMAATKTRTGKVADDEIALVRLMLKVRRPSEATPRAKSPEGHELLESCSPPVRRSSEAAPDLLQPRERNRQKDTSC